jgi:hypothetical protein
MFGLGGELMKPWEYASRNLRVGIPLHWTKDLDQYEADVEVESAYCNNDEDPNTLAIRTSTTYMLAGDTLLLLVVDKTQQNTVEATLKKFPLTHAVRLERYHHLATMAPPDSHLLAGHRLDLSLHFTDSSGVPTLMLYFPASPDQVQGFLNLYGKLAERGL